jgi:hypothetical protein
MGRRDRSARRPDTNADPNGHADSVGDTDTDADACPST